MAGSSEAEYVEICRFLSSSDLVDAIELNISCPNVSEGGVAFGTNAKVAYDLTKKVKGVCQKPVYVKLTPNLMNIVEIAKAVEAAGADGISMLNTLTTMRIDVSTGKPILGNKTGGLSGPTIFPLAIRMIYDVSRAVKVPIIGMGGVSCVDDVLEMMMAGASVVAVGTANLYDPFICSKLIEGLPDRMDELGIESLESLISGVKRNCKLDR